MDQGQPASFCTLRVMTFTPMILTHCDSMWHGRGRVSCPNKAAYSPAETLPTLPQC
jgi:hypothetical protein